MAWVTLIELSIVLVVIGLLAGGILVGRDLIKAAEVRAQFSQIEKYQTAVNTFKDRYGALPGDIKDPDATNFGFISRGTLPGQGDGNGIIEGVDNTGLNSGFIYNSGETIVFWVDLSTAKLIDGTFSVASSTVFKTASLTSSPSLNAFLPTARLGSNNFIGVWSSSNNYFALSAVTNITCCNGTALLARVGISVAQAFAIDSKIDDGLPQAGNVQAKFPNAGGVQWANSLWGSDTGNYLPEPIGVTTCYDNGNVSYVTRTYSITQSNGTGMNCALSFKFQ